MSVVPVDMVMSNISESLDYDFHHEVTNDSSAAVLSNSGHDTERGVTVAMEPLLPLAVIFIIITSIYLIIVLMAVTGNILL